MCWNYSPLLKNERGADWKKVMIEKNLAFKIIDQAKEIGFRTVLFSGAGEPFTHPNMIDFLKRTSSKKLRIVIQTNLLLADPIKLSDAVKKVKGSKLTIICVNLSAATPKTYKKIHGSTKERDFHNVLKKIRILRKNGIKVRIVYVVNKENYQEIEEAIRINNRLDSFLHLELADFAQDEGTERMSLNNKEVGEILKKSFKKLDNNNIKDFIEQLKYRGIGVSKIKRCLIGYNFCAIDEVGNVYYCFNRTSNRFLMGSLKDLSLIDIWSSAKYKRMRKRLKSGGFYKDCKGYCIKDKKGSFCRGSNFKLRFYIDSDILPPRS